MHHHSLDIYRGLCLNLRKQLQPRYPLYQAILAILYQTLATHKGAMQARKARIMARLRIEAATTIDDGKEIWWT